MATLPGFEIHYAAGPPVILRPTGQAEWGRQIGASGMVRISREDVWKEIPADRVGEFAAWLRGEVFATVGTLAQAAADVVASFASGEHEAALAHCDVLSRRVRFSVLARGTLAFEPVIDERADDKADE